MEKLYCCKHRGLKILLPSLNVKDTQNYACQHSWYPWGEASFSGDAVWPCLWKNLLSSHRDTELISHNKEEWARLGNSEISITGWILSLVSRPVYAQSSIFVPISSIGSCTEHVYPCICTHITTHIFLWGSIPENQFISEIVAVPELLPLFLTEMGQFNSFSGKDETEKKNIACKYHAVSAPQLICKLLPEMTLKKDRQSTLPVCNRLGIFSSYLIT